MVITLLSGGAPGEILGTMINQFYHGSRRLSTSLD